MKHEWKKHEKELYLLKVSPARIVVPMQKFFALYGKGDPNGKEFSDAIGVLYSLSYAVKMLPKKDDTPEGYFDYTVYPLEAIWDQTEIGKASDGLNKSDLIIDLMIRQPDFLADKLASQALEPIRKKKPHQLLDKVEFRCIEDGLCIPMLLHIGPYDDELASFKKIELFCVENGLKRTDVTHREIYLSDARKTAPEKLKTVLRYAVR